MSDTIYSVDLSFRPSDHSIIPCYHEICYIVLILSHSDGTLQIFELLCSQAFSMFVYICSETTLHTNEMSVVIYSQVILCFSVINHMSVSQKNKTFGKNTMKNKPDKTTENNTIQLISSGQTDL